VRSPSTAPFDATSRFRGRSPSCARLTARRYASPELNEVLYLHHRGITALKNLDPYVNLRCLHLENNALSSLEGVGGLVALTQLHVDGNLLQDVRGVERLSNLTHLSASDNIIESLEHIRGHQSLHTVCLAGNRLCDARRALSPLGDVASLRALDVTRNDITDANVAETVSALAPNLELLFITRGNPIEGDLSDVTTALIRALPRLRWLDDAVVDVDRRRVADARANRGPDAELQERQLIFQERQNALDADRDAFPASCAALVDALSAAS